MDDLTKDKDFIQVFDRSVEAAALLTLAAVGRMQGNPSAQVAVAVGVACSALMSVTAIVNNATFENMREPTDDDRLFAALLTYMVCRGSTAQGIQFDYHCGTILEAMNEFERVTGRRPDSFLRQDMVTAARDMEAAGSGPMKAFMEQHYPGGAAH